MPKQRVTKAVIATATVAVLAEQKATYDFLSEKLGGKSMEFVKRVMRALVKAKVVGNGKGRGYIVLQNADGTPKEGIEVGTKRRRRVRRTREKASQAAPAKRAKTNSAFSIPDKLRKIDELIKAAGPQNAAVLRSIRQDVKHHSSGSAAFNALKD